MSIRALYKEYYNAAHNPASPSPVPVPESLAKHPDQFQIYTPVALQNMHEISHFKTFIKEFGRRGPLKRGKRSLPENASTDSYDFERVVEIRITENLLKGIN